MFTVFYKSAPNYNRTYPQNADRRVRSRSFKEEKSAREFAKQVNGYKIVNPCGQII